MERFRSRQDAGEKLFLEIRAGQQVFDLVFALARGGIPVAYPVARGLGVPLWPMVVRKIGMPGHEELALGAVSEGKTVTWNEDLLRQIGHFPPDDRWSNGLLSKARSEVGDKVARLRNGASLPDISGKRVLVVDDGVATGATLLAALRELRSRSPLELTVALPVAPRDILPLLRRESDHQVILWTPRDFEAVGGYYEDFTQVSDHDVLELLKR